MAELNLKQIEDRLNDEFAKEPNDRRKLIFWYDDRAEFVEDVDSLHLDNAKILHLGKDNQFATKLLLEQEDKKTNYLIYAPFPKPDVHLNHLEDTLLYSTRFYADRASLLILDLHIPEDCKPLLEKHIKFFANKERTNKFHDLDIGHYDNKTILLGMMCVLAGCRTCSFEGMLRIVLSQENQGINDVIKAFENYDLLKPFWDMCDSYFGMSFENPSVSKLVIALFATCADRELTEPVPDAWKPFIMSHSNNAINFLDGMMNNVNYQETFDDLSQKVNQQLRVKESLQSYPRESLIKCVCFADIDDLLIDWIADRLEKEDLGASLDTYDIPKLCDFRKKTHFGKKRGNAYDMFLCAFRLESLVGQSYPDGFKKIIDAYQKDLYRADMDYRHFYYYLDQLPDAGNYESLRKLVENIYTNEYLGKLLPKWNEGIMENNALTVVPLQRKFYNHYVADSKDRVVVIISDAMRYEVGQELFDKLKDNPRSKITIEPMLSTLPSYTRLGMGALLPHKKLEISPDGKELVDGTYCIDISTREKVLQAYQPRSRCLQFDDLKNKKGKDLRNIFNGQQVIYVYHDQIDVRGEHEEDEVFQACYEAINEIYDFILKIHNGVNTHHFIVTADHGFIYKRDKAQESDKIGNVQHHDIVKRRYIISDEGVHEDGVQSLNLGYLLGNDDSRMVSFPLGASVFKTQGSGGQNYVHGGSSPQEMLVPVIEVHMERGKVEPRLAEIQCISTTNKITNQTMKLDFIQSDPVGDGVKEATYRIRFVDSQGNVLTNENLYTADSREEDPSKRIFKCTFSFKNQKYESNEPCFLSVINEKTGVEVLRKQFVIDLPFAGDFGFDL